MRRTDEIGDRVCWTAGGSRIYSRSSASKIFFGRPPASRGRRSRITSTSRSRTSRDALETLSTLMYPSSVVVLFHVHRHYCRLEVAADRISLFLVPASMQFHNLRQYCRNRRADLTRCSVLPIKAKTLVERPNVVAVGAGRICRGSGRAASSASRLAPSA